MILNDNWLKNDDYNNKQSVLGDVLTTKEVEKLYELPVNTVVQDIRRGKIDYSHVRQGGKVWLITRAEANKQYSKYRETRSKHKTNLQELVTN